MKSHYETLGLTPSASKSEIDAEWRRAARLWHPDRNTSAEAAERMKEVNAAHHVLSNESRRRRYDISNGFVTPGRPHMRPPAADSPEAKKKEPESAKRNTDSQFKKTVPSESGRRWWIRLMESLDDQAGAAQAEKVRTVTLLERRPRLTKFVLLPLGIASILFAAALTLMLA